MKKQSVLATDLKQADDEIIRRIHQREKKGNIWRAYQDYILCIEDDLKSATDINEITRLTKELKKIKKEQKQYYVPSILEMATYGKKTSTSENKTALEKSSFSLVKKSNRIRKEK